MLTKRVVANSVALVIKLRLRSPPERTSAVPRAVVAVEKADSNSLTTGRMLPRPELEPPSPPSRPTKAGAQLSRQMISVAVHLRRVVRRPSTVVSRVLMVVRTDVNWRFSASASAAGAGSATGYAKTLEATARPTKKGLKKRMVVEVDFCSRDTLLRWSIGSMGTQFDFWPSLYLFTRLIIGQFQIRKPP